MRFSLLTLLIAMTALGGVLARIAWLRQQRDQHRREANGLIRHLSSYASNPTQYQEQLEREIAQRPGDYTTFLPEYSFSRPDWTNLSPQEQQRLNRVWIMAHGHTVLAKRFADGIYRPWAPVWDDPHSAPDSVGWFDFRTGALLAVGGATLIAACCFVPRLWKSRGALSISAPTISPTFRFTARDFGWLVLVVALACAWRMESSSAWLAQWRAKQQESRATAADYEAHLFDKQNLLIEELREQLRKEQSKSRAASTANLPPSPPATYEASQNEPSSPMP